MAFSNRAAQGAVVRLSSKREDGVEHIVHFVVAHVRAKPQLCMFAALQCSDAPPRLRIAPFRTGRIEFCTSFAALRAVMVAHPSSVHLTKLATTFQTFAGQPSWVVSGAASDPIDLLGVASCTRRKPTFDPSDCFEAALNMTPARVPALRPHIRRVRLNYKQRVDESDSEDRECTSRASLAYAIGKCAWVSLSELACRLTVTEQFGLPAALAIGVFSAALAAGCFCLDVYAFHNRMPSGNSSAQN